MESIPISGVTSIKETAETYLHQLGYHGIMEAEFKRDPRDGIFKLLEINARSWWQNSFPAKCGINIVFISYLDAIGEEIEYTEDYEAGIKWIYFLNDLRSSIKTSNNMTIKEWASSLHGIKDWAYFSADDPIPWVLSLLFSLSAFTKMTSQRGTTRN
jgi:predicted ATP-grasp superfamily ATP-dependent carboligase